MDLVIRPAAVLGITEAHRIVRALERSDVARGGVWNVSPGMWQRFDRPWDGPNGTRGSARLVGSVAVVYDRPRRNEILVYRATVTAYGVESGWSTGLLCDDALVWADLTLDSCPRVELGEPPAADPFHLPVQRARGQVPSKR